MGPGAEDLLDLVRRRGGVDRPGACASGSPRLHIEAEVLRLIRLRTVTARIKGEQPGPEASIRKVLADEHGQRIMGLAKDLAGSAGMLDDAGPLGTEVAGWHTATCSHRRSPSAAAPVRCSATSWPNGCSGFPTTWTSRWAGPGPRLAAVG